MKNILIVIMAAFILAGCEAGQVNYLRLEHARYNPDTVYFKSVLDPADPGDARRIKYEIPFETGSLEGIEGGFPLAFSICDAVCEEGNRAAIPQFYLGIMGKISLPWNHTVPCGCYTFRVEVSNEGGRNSGVLENAVTIVVK